MEVYKRKLKQMGIILVVLGLLDGVGLAHSIYSNESYSANVLLGIIPGVLLIRGSLGACRFIGWTSAFQFCALLGLFSVLLYIYPVSYFQAIAHHNPSFLYVTSIFSSLYMILLIWLYFTSVSEVVLEERAQRNLKRTKHETAFVFGLVLCIAGGVFANSVLKGEYAEHALATVKTKYGSNYEYVVRSISISSSSSEGKEVEAIIEAYNQQEMGAVRVAWKPDA